VVARIVHITQAPRPVAMTLAQMSLVSHETIFEQSELLVVLSVMQL
jgi:hypothetical protein